MCPPGTTGLPLTGCSPLATCGFNSDCDSSEACIDRMCKDPCESTNCPGESQCRVERHRPFCQCPDGYTGNPESGCRRDTCRVDSDCLKDEICKDGRCQDPCSHCGSGALCSTEGGQVLCLCPEGTTGNPTVSCNISKPHFLFLL